MAQKSGFFTALQSGGEYDRVYTSADYCDNLATVIKTGVRYSTDNDLQVSAGNNMYITVGIGRAWIKGRWYHNDTELTTLAVPTAPVGSNSRIDRVVLRLDTSVSARSIVAAVKQGTAAASPVAPALTRSGDIYEIGLATIRVNPGVTAITDANITDTRADGNVCGWAASVTPAIMSMLKQYVWTTTIAATTNTVDFEIAQYDAEDVHILNVYTNGILETIGIDYTISGNTITFSGAKQIGTEIKVILYKSIDGTGLDSVADEIAAIQTQLAAIQTDYDTVYICNGVNDNVMLSQIAQTWISGGTDYGNKRIRVHGTFGATAPNAGSGTSSNLYRWFDFGDGTATNRKITFDFSSCSQINISCADATYNVIFYGMHVNIIGANVIATGGAAVYMFSTAGATVINAENCRFWITSQAGIIARGGTFRDCRTSLTLNGENAWNFNVLTGGLLRIFGGEHYAYAANGYESGVVYVNSAQTNAVAITYGINCPTTTRSGYVQSYAINCLTNNEKCSFTDTISALAVNAPGQNIRGTIAISKAGLM